MMTLRLNSVVVAVDPSPAAGGPSLTLSTGEVLRADLVVGADGVKSMVREVVLGEPTKAVATGDAAYRVIIPAERLLADPELRPLVETAYGTSLLANAPFRAVFLRRTCHSERAKLYISQKVALSPYPRPLPPPEREQGFPLCSCGVKEKGKHSHVHLMSGHDRERGRRLGR